MKKLHCLYLVLISFALNVSAQSTDFKNPDEILIEGNQVPKVLLVGTFHFSYPDLDAHVTDKDKRVDVVSAKRQEELQELLTYIGKFKPTKIMVEARKGTKVNQELAAYKVRRYALGKNEIDQIAYRLAKKFNIKELGLTDANTLVRDFMHGPDSTCMTPIMDHIYTDWDFQSDDPVIQRYKSWYNYIDDLKTEHSLLEIFKYMNADKNVIRGHGAYLVGDFKNGENWEGADALAMHWYARNLRIFRNIQKENCTAEDRILVLYGAGHMSILKHLFESTPEYELVSFKDLEDYPDK